MVKNSEDFKKCVEENKPEEWNLNYCNVFSQEEKDCLSQQGKVPFFDENKIFNSCERCPSGAGCDRYIDERYCNLDPCNIGCTWDGFFCKSASEVKTESKIFKFCEVSGDKDYKFSVEFP